MGLFDKKYCDFCGKKIGLLGNKKLEDGNMCRECAAKLSPWFSERRHSSKEEIAAQLAYREENRAAVDAFRTTRSIGRYKKLLLDEDTGKFTVTSAKSMTEENPDILDFSQITGCDLDINETRHELKTTDKDGKSVSYVPPRFEYSYDFRVSIHVNHPYFDEMQYSLSNGYVKTGERQMTASPAGWRVNQVGIITAPGLRAYYEYLNMGREIHETLENIRMNCRQEAASAAAPKVAVTCPYCGASTVPDEKGCCEYCGSALK
jgi:hypothetical protein